MADPANKSYMFLASKRPRRASSANLLHESELYTITGPTESCESRTMIRDFVEDISTQFPLPMLRRAFRQLFDPGSGLSCDISTITLTTNAHVRLRSLYYADRLLAIGWACYRTGQRGTVVRADFRDKFD